MGRRMARWTGTVALAALTAAGLAAQQWPWYSEGDFHPTTRLAFDLVNELDEERVNVPVIVLREAFPVRDLHELDVTVVDPQLPPAPEPSKQRLMVEGGHGLRGEVNGHILLQQMDDLDKDGVWDELFFVTSLKPRETRRIFLYLGTNQRGWNPHETHAGLGSYVRHLVPFWESKHIGWKLWFPTSVDVYGKRKPMLVSPRLYIENLDGYGVTLIDPARLDVRGHLECGRDVVIDVNCVFEGRVVLGDGVKVGAHCVLRDVTVAESGEIRPFCHLEGAAIGARAQIGPYSRLRPGTELAEEVHVGNFVELKNAQVGFNSKINHLSYVGDASVGRKVNIGAGTITCNYDGANKHRTVIGDRAFIGSDTQLVAPVTVGEGATLGAGTTLTQDAPANQLTLSRARQFSLPDWQRPVKKK